MMAPMPARSAHRVVAAALVVTMASAACSATEDPGDPEAFCELLREGVGLTAGGTDRLDELETAAPPDIRVGVRQLANTVRSLDEIPDADLGELFSAAFDPEAVEARSTLLQYAVDQCGSAPTVLDEPLEAPLDSAEADAQLLEYVTTNFGTTAWVPLLTVETVFEFGRLDSVRGEFSDEPPTPVDSLAACNALAVYLYELQDGVGEVTVRLGDTLLAGRSGPASQCVRP